MFDLQHPVEFDNDNGWHYGQWTGRLHHPGRDYNRGFGKTDLGDPVRPYGVGKVVYAQWYGNGWGNMVWVRHEFNLTTEEINFIKSNPILNKINIEDGKAVIWSRYAHLQEINVEVGDMVDMEILIGKVGGTASKGKDWSPHMHGELWVEQPDYNGYVVGWSKELVLSKTLNPVQSVKESDKLKKAKEVAKRPPNWSLDAIKSMQDKGIMGVNEDGQPIGFRANDNVTRAELAVVIDRLINYMDS